MIDQIARFLILTGIILLFMLVWVVSIFVVRWDIQGRNLSRSQSLLWLAAVALLPLVGLFAYLGMRMVGAILPTPAGEPSRPDSKRATLPKRPDELNRRLATLPAVEAGSPPYPAPSRAPIPQTLTAAPRTYILKSMEGPSAGKDFPLASFPLRIGRGPEVDIRLDEDRGVSRYHAEIYDQDGQLRLRDLGSLHGTFVNGRQISEQPLEPGDEIGIGITRLILNVIEAR